MSHSWGDRRSLPAKAHTRLFVSALAGDDHKVGDRKVSPSITSSRVFTKTAGRVSALKQAFTPASSNKRTSVIRICRVSTAMRGSECSCLKVSICRTALSTPPLLASSTSRRGRCCCRSPGAKRSTREARATTSNCASSSRRAMPSSNKLLSPTRRIGYGGWVVTI
jgi:hypothetical protein